MAETTASDEQLPEANTSSSSSAEEMDVDSPKPEAKADDKSKQSRGREEDDKDPSGDDKPTDSKKQKVDDRKGKAKVEEQSEEKKKKKKKKKKEKKKEEEEANKDIPTGPVKLGYRTFDSSLDIFDCLYKFLHFWPLNVDVNKYEHQMLLELLQKGHKDAAQKIGVGVRSFQVRMHPTWMGRFFFLIREDGSEASFRFRRCINSILPLPDEMLPQPDVDKYLRSKKKYSKQGRPAGGGLGM